MHVYRLAHFRHTAWKQL